MPENTKLRQKNELGESNATISLNFDSGDDAGGFAPSFIEKPRIIPNEEGTLIILRCKCTASPKPVVTWFKGNKSISESSKIKMKVIEKENTYELVLEISDPVGPDSGTYRCHVKNDHGESNANLNLNIEAEPEQEGDPPTFVEKPRIRSENNGKLVVMDCVVKANPKPEVVWYHNGVTISQSTKLSWKVEEKGDHYHIRLELRNPGKDDQGLYKCNIKNGNGELNANLTLNIEIIPVIKQAPKVVTINKKKSAVIECRVQSVFEPQVIWMKENTVVRESHNKKTRIERITDGEYIVKLEMEPCSQADKGNYKLTVKNEKGEATSTLIEVTEIPEDDAPKAPTISQKLKAQTVNEGSTINLESSLSVLDKTVKVSWYKNSSEITESSSTKTSFDGKCAKLIISSAKSTNSGTYKVKFSNKAGSSESSAEIVVKEKRKLEEEEEKEEKKVKQKKSEKKEVKEETDISISEKDEESIMDWEDDEEDTLMDVDEISFSKDDKKRKSESEEETVKTKKASIKKEEKASVTEKRRSSLLKKEEKYVSSDEESVTEKSRRSSILKKNEQTSVTEKRRSSLLKKEEKIFSSQEEKVTESRRSSIVKKEEAVNNIDEKKSKVTSKTSKKSEAEVVENSVTPKKEVEKVSTPDSSVKEKVTRKSSTSTTKVKKELSPQSSIEEDSVKSDYSKKSIRKASEDKTNIITERRSSLKKGEDKPVENNISDKPKIIKEEFKPNSSTSAKKVDQSNDSSVTCIVEENESFEWPPEDKNLNIKRPSLIKDEIIPKNLDTEEDKNKRKRPSINEPESGNKDEPVNLNEQINKLKRASIAKDETIKIEETPKRPSLKEEPVNLNEQLNKLKRASITKDETIKIEEKPKKPSLKEEPVNLNEQLNKLKRASITKDETVKIEETPKRPSLKDEKKVEEKPKRPSIKEESIKVEEKPKKHSLKEEIPEES